MTKALASLALMAMLATACHRDKNTVITTTGTEDSEKPGPAFELPPYPLAVGNMWVYDSGDTIQVVSDTVINGINAVKVRRWNAYHTHTTFCANLPDGLRMLSANYYGAFQSFINGAIDEPDTFMTPVIPVRFTRMPARVEESWEANIPNMKNSERQWLGFFTVTTRAGTFNCIKLTAGYFDEYYSEKGIVKRVDRMLCLVAPCPEPQIKLVYVNF